MFTQGKQSSSAYIKNALLKYLLNLIIINLIVSVLEQKSSQQRNVTTDH